MLEIKNLSKTFLKGTPNEHKALDGISLSLDKGEFVTVIGSNGAGKSTLFNAIAGEFLCDGGKIVLDGKNITYKKEYFRDRAIGRLFQAPKRGPAPVLTIEEILALVYSKATRHLFSPALKKRDVEFFREKLLKLNMGLEDRLKTKMGQLSGGQRQAVTLMMSTLVTPKLLLLDEHTAALDPLTAEKVLDITQRIVAENSITTMMITHNIKSALKLGTRTIMLECGKSVLDLKGDERNNMTVQDLLGLYRQKSGKELDNDRMLLTGE